MGGSSGGGGNSGGGAPPQAQQIDYKDLMKSASEAAAAQVEAQYANLVKYYPDMERQQLGSVQNIGNLLSPQGGELKTWKKDASGNWTQESIGTAAPNEYTGLARQAAIDALGQRPNVEAGASKLGGIGDWIMQRAEESYRGSAPTAIESELERQAQADLSLGRSLSAAEIRDAQQSARAAMGARGLGTSGAGAAAEILNRDAAAQAREAARRNFAAGTNNMVQQNVMARRDQSAQQAALGSNVLGNSANLYNTSANLGLAGAQGMMAIDPIQRGIAPGIGMGSNIQSTGANMIGNTYNSANQMAGNVASFNANMLDSRYNSYQNNQASLQAAGMQSSAMNNAAMMGIISQGIGSAIQAGGMVGAAHMGAPMMFSDKRMKKDIKPIGKAGKVLGLTAYEFKYKGDDEKRVGFMAQDVQKVLPEAVTELNYKGKKRLAIAPAVIGAALAQELTTAKAA